jgi:hypothetical protein
MIGLPSKAYYVVTMISGGGVIVFGFTGANGTSALASYSVDGERPTVPPVPSSDSPTLLPLFTYSAPPLRPSKQQAQFLTTNLTILVGNVSQVTLPSDFILSHVMALPFGSGGPGGSGFAFTAPTKASSTSSVAIVGGVLGSVILLLAIGIAMLILRRRARDRARSTLWRRRYPARSFQNTGGVEFYSLSSNLAVLTIKGRFYFTDAVDVHLGTPRGDGYRVLSVREEMDATAKGTNGEGRHIVDQPGRHASRASS